MSNGLVRYSAKYVARESFRFVQDVMSRFSPLLVVSRGWQPIDVCGTLCSVSRLLTAHLDECSLFLAGLLLHEGRVPAAALPSALGPSRA